MASLRDEHRVLLKKERREPLPATYQINAHAHLDLLATFKTLLHPFTNPYKPPRPTLKNKPSAVKALAPKPALRYTSHRAVYRLTRTLRNATYLCCGVQSHVGVCRFGVRRRDGQREQRSDDFHMRAALERVSWLGHTGCADFIAG